MPNETIIGFSFCTKARIIKADAWFEIYAGPR